MESVRSPLLSLGSEPGPVLRAGVQETQVTQVWTLVQPMSLEDKSPGPESSGQTVIRAVKQGQRARESLKKCNNYWPLRLEMCGKGLENREPESNVHKGR